MGAADYSEGYTRNIWQQALEFGAIALDRYDYTGDEAFLKKTIDWCDKALSFYDTRFKKDASGKVIINPSHGLETYWEDVTGDMPSIAGLQEISSRLLALPERFTTSEQRALAADRQSRPGIAEKKERGRKNRAGRCP